MKQEEKKPREFWIKITSLDKVEMGGFRYSDAEISVDPKCGENYEDFKNAIHVIEYSAYEDLKAKLETAKRTLEHYSCSYQQVISTGTDLARAALKEIEGE